MPPLVHLSSLSELQSFVSQHACCVVTFSATWCGPCQASKPALEQLAQNTTTSIMRMGIVYEHDLGGDLSLYNIRAFPTHCLFVHHKEHARVEGANVAAVQRMIEQQVPAGLAAMMGQGGEALGTTSSASALSPEEARLQRLAKLETKQQQQQQQQATKKQHEAASTAPSSSDDVEMKDVEDTDKETPAASALPASSSSPAPAPSCDAQALQTLTEVMGFSLIRAQKGLLLSNNTVEGAVEWIAAHEDDKDIDEPITTTATTASSSSSSSQQLLKPQSYKCNTCGKILSNLANLELHANKTGHSDFDESLEHAPILTQEQKAAKILEIKQLLHQKRLEREEEEKKDAIEKEKQRRNNAKEMTQTKEQYEIEQRKREAYLRKKEKQAFQKERARIQAELAKDKAERQANKGKLKTKLGVEGYHPDAIQYDVDATMATKDHAAGSGDMDSDNNTALEHKKKQVKTVDVNKIDEYIGKVASYRAGGDGGKCLKVLKAYVSNVVDHPEDEKFRSINMDNKVFKTRVKPLIGGKQLLMAIGFQQHHEGQDVLVLTDTPDRQLLADTKDKLEAAIVKYDA